MKRKLSFFFLLIVLVGCLFFGNVNYVNVNADNEKIYLGGMPAGFSIRTRGAQVVGLCDVVTENGLKTPSKDADLQVGDVIIKIDGADVNSASDVERSLISKKDVELSIKRNQEIINKIIKPAKDMSGNNKLGIFIRDDVSGIGTITYIKGDRLASLGHPVINDDGSLVDILGGQVFFCNITGCVKGERGKAGELRGVFLKNNPIASIDKNLNCGVYGNVYKGFDFSELNEITLGEAKPGDAEIFTTINGCEPDRYKISIVKIDNLGSNKNFVIKIEDEKLFATSGGIVQGMSGSPIVQDGKLVGAVTHVFINDPTRGFGISISNMINN